MNRARVLVTDSLRTLRTAVQNLVARESDFAVFEAATLDESLSVADEHVPNVLLVVARVLFARGETAP